LLVEELNISFVGSQDPDDHANGGCLPCSVRTQKSEHTALPNLKTEIIDGGKIPETFCL
jgi:hypothetical protein